MWCVGSKCNDRAVEGIRSTERGEVANVMSLLGVAPSDYRAIGDVRAMSTLAAADMGAPAAAL